MVTTTLIEQVLVGPMALPGVLYIPRDTHALVVLVHGSGSNRRSVRNRRIAQLLHRHGLGTLLFDLLGKDEATDPRHVFDIGLLASRVGAALDWVARRNDLAALPIGLFGAGTGAAAAIVAAAQLSGRVAALVSRGGRPDLARAHLAVLQAPVLLVVGGADLEVLAANRAALGVLRCRKRLEVIPGATHRFEEPAALDSVAALAADWFDQHLATSHPG